MCNISGKNGRINYEKTRSEIRNFDPTDSWENSTSALDEAIKIITVANNKSNLFAILKQLKINLIKTNDVNGWEYKANCPFPHHKDNTPSFGYNTKEDRFYCFGCRGSGRTVEFLSLFYKIPKLDIAKNILMSQGISKDEYLDVLPYTNETNQINEKLFEFAKYLRDLKNKYIHDNIKLKYINNIIYCSDMYLFHAVEKRKINLFELNARIIKYKEFLERLCGINEQY